MNVAYVRVSTEEQATEGTSLQVQEDRIKAYAQAMGFEIEKVYIDSGISAKDMSKRPALCDIIKGVTKREITGVVVLKLDRLTRSVKDLGALVEMFNKYDVKLISVTEALDTGSASGRMFINIVGVFSQWERETIAERTKTALDHRREGGRVYGPVPFGYRLEDDGRMVGHLGEMATLREISHRRSVGVSYQKIAKDLNAMGSRPRRGKKWHPSSVHSVMHNLMTPSLTEAAV